MNESTVILDPRASRVGAVRGVRSPGATPLHHPAWAALIADCYRFRGFVVALRDATGELVAGAPFIEVGRRRRWVSLAFTDYCAPLGDLEAAGRPLRALEEQRLANGLRSIELRDQLGAERGRKEQDAGRLPPSAGPRRRARRDPHKPEPFAGATGDPAGSARRRSREARREPRRSRRLLLAPPRHASQARRADPAARIFRRPVGSSDRERGWGRYSSPSSADEQSQPRSSSGGGTW